MVDLGKSLQPRAPAQPLPNQEAQIFNAQILAAKEKENPLLSAVKGFERGQEIQEQAQDIEEQSVDIETKKAALEHNNFLNKLIREEKEEDRKFAEQLQTASVDEQLNVLLSTPPKIVNRNIDTARAAAARIEAKGSQGHKDAINLCFRPQFDRDRLLKQQDADRDQGFELAKIDRRGANQISVQETQIEAVNKRANVTNRLKRQKEKRLAKEGREKLTLKEREVSAKERTAQTGNIKKDKQEMVFLLGRGSKGEAAQRRFQEEADRISIAFRNSRGKPAVINGVVMNSEQEAQTALREQFKLLLKPEDQNLVSSVAPAAITEGLTTTQQQQQTQEFEIQRRIDQKISEIRERLKARGTTIKDESALRTQLREIVLKELGLK